MRETTCLAHDNFNGGETDHEGLSKNVCFLWQTAGQGPGRLPRADDWGQNLSTVAEVSFLQDKDTFPRAPPPASLASPHPAVSCVLCPAHMPVPGHALLSPGSRLSCTWMAGAQKQSLAEISRQASIAVARCRARPQVCLLPLVIMGRQVKETVRSRQQRIGRGCWRS